MKAGWEVKPLGEVCELKPPKKLAKAVLGKGDLVSFAGMSELGELQANFNEKDARPLSKVYSSYTYFANDDVLVAKITPCFENGKMGIARNLTNGIGFGSSEFVPLRSNGEIIPEFLFYYLLRDKFRVNGTKVMSGAVGHKRVPHEYFLELPIPIPPLEEQKRIVAVLDKAFEGLDRAKQNAEANLQSARELFDRGLFGLLSGLSNVPLTKLGQVATFHNGDRGKNYPNKVDYVDDGIPWLNTGHIMPNGSLSAEKMNFITKEKFESLRGGNIEKGDLVFCLRGATIGKTAFVYPYEVGAVASSLMIIRPSNALSSRFAYYFLTSSLGKEEIEKFIGGAAQPNLAGKSVGQFNLPLPSIEQQKSICDQLDYLRWESEKLQKNYQVKLRGIADLRQSLLQKAFAGELT